MADYSNPAILEVHEVVKTVDFLLATNRMFRIEVVQIAKGTNQVHYDVRYFERQTLHKAQDGTIREAGESLSGPRFDVWVPAENLPWVNQDSVDAALQQALDWVVERRNNTNSSDWTRESTPK